MEAHSDVVPLRLLGDPLAASPPSNLHKSTPVAEGERHAAGRERSERGRRP
jgi:hypothetical protein